jgi:hypothetical protein
LISDLSATWLVHAIVDDDSPVAFGLRSGHREVNCHSALERNWADEEWSNENGLHYQFPVDSEHWEARIDESLGRLLAGKRDVGRDFLDSYR